jgi:hypothetical protein
MKNWKILMLLFLCLATSANAQQFRDQANLSLFAGGYAAQQNSNDNGTWYGLYVEYMPIKTKSEWRFGLCGVASQVQFNSNDTKSNYNGSSSDFGGGIAIGKYVEYLNFSKSAYVGANVMIKQSQDIGNGESYQEDKTLGKYDMNQKDLMISWEININLLKISGNNEKLFTRSQLRIFSQEPLKSNRDAFWNNSPIKESAVWNKASIGAEFKQSIYQIGQNQTILDPKLVIGYNYNNGGKSNWVYGGFELALKKQGQDDFLSIYSYAKQEVGNYAKNLNSLQFVFGLNFQPFNIKSR